MGSGWYPYILPLRKNEPKGSKLQNKINTEIDHVKN